jgi:hypothetical protein
MIDKSVEPCSIERDNHQTTTRFGVRLMTAKVQKLYFGRSLPQWGLIAGLIAAGAYALFFM